MDLTASQTSTTLLRQVAEGVSPAAEALFYDRYSRMARTVILGSGIRAQDCDDVVQEAMIVAVERLRDGGYQRDKGGFRAWFKGVLRHKIAHAWRDASRTVAPAASLPDKADSAPTPAEAFEAVFDAEAQAVAIEEALDEIKAEVEPTTWQAFDLITRKGWTPKEVTRHLGKTRSAIDQAVKRVKDRLIHMLK